MAEILLHIRKTFCNVWIIGVSATAAAIWNYIFPNTEYLNSAIAVLIVMGLDVLTKLYTLSKTSGGLICAFRKHIINSHSFMRGTIQKLIIFMIVLILCGAGYRLFPSEGIATTITQTACIAMFLRDALSILENMSDAGWQGLGIFKKIFKNKLDELCDNTDDESEELNADNNQETDEP